MESQFLGKQGFVRFRTPFYFRIPAIGENGLMRRQVGWFWPGGVGVAVGWVSGPPSTHERASGRRRAFTLPPPPNLLFTVHRFLPTPPLLSPPLPPPHPPKYVPSLYPTKLRPWHLGVKTGGAEKSPMGQTWQTDKLSLAPYDGHDKGQSQRQSTLIAAQSHT